MEIYGFKQGCYWKLNEKVKKSGLVSWVLALTGLGIIVFLVFSVSTFYHGCYKEKCWSVYASALYNGFSRSVYVLAIFMVILPTFHGRLRMVKSFLGSDIFTVLA